MSRSRLPHDAVVYPCSDGQPIEASRQEAAARRTAEARVAELEARLRDLEGTLTPAEAARTRYPT